MEHDDGAAAMHSEMAAGRTSPDDPASCSCDRTMSTTNPTGHKQSGTTLESVGDYDYELSAHATHRWEHVDTGLTVECSKTAGYRDGYGNTDVGYTARVRDADGEFIEELIGVSACLPTKADAVATVREWIEAHPEGELEGDR